MSKMENSVIDFLQLSESQETTLDSSNNRIPYVSFIKINGRPILPPLIDEKKRKELQKLKEKAIELELKLAKKRKKSLSSLKQITTEFTSTIDVDIAPIQQSTPARPASLNLAKKEIGKTFVLTKSRTESQLHKYTDNPPADCEFVSSHRSAKNLDKRFRSTLEQRLASGEHGTITRNKLNTCQQSPITEENFPEKLADPDQNTKKEKKLWSPLQIDSINSLKIELPTKDTQGTDDNLEVSLDESQNTPETVTQSPSLMRQNSYTLLTPSPALLQFLESQKDQTSTPRSQSGRKTWDLTKAKKNWDHKHNVSEKSSDDEGPERECGARFFAKKTSSSLDSLSAVQNNSCGDYHEYSLPNSLAYDSGTSPESYNSKRTAQKVPKVKSRLKGKKVRSTRSVPSPDQVDKVPFKDVSKSMQGIPGQNSRNPECGKDLSELSNLLLKMKVDFERQKRELEERQQSEMKKLEILFQRKEAELLNNISNLPRKTARCIYTQSSQGTWPQGSGQEDHQMMGDGNLVHRKGTPPNSRREEPGKRPHSAKDSPHIQCYANEHDCNRRTRSMDFNQGNQDTDLDFSFQDDFLQSKDTTLNNEYIIESDSISNFSSHSSTVSSDNRHDLAHVYTLKKFQGVSSEECARYNEAATKITAAARGFLIRRLLRTAHVQGLITTLRDAINCANQLHTASDIADSDIDLMRRLSRQIEAAWDAVYAVFFGTETSAKLQLIASDRERLRAAVTKTPRPGAKQKGISAATRKSLDRKKAGTLMSKSQTSNGFARVRICSKMAASYPSPYFPQKLK